jgi:acetolactate synthase I/III small subunit
VKHTLAVQIEDRPGALARVTHLFARRGYNIESLAVGPSERPDVSRLTLRVEGSGQSVEQIVKQMHKLVNVLRVTELTADEGVERELALITVAAPPDRRSELLALGDVFGARVAELGHDSIVFELVGRSEQIESFEELLRPHGIRELARTGRIALRRPQRAQSARARALTATTRST